MNKRNRLGCSVDAPGRVLEGAECEVELMSLDVARTVNTTGGGLAKRNPDRYDFASPWTESVLASHASRAPPWPPGEALVSGTPNPWNSAQSAHASVRGLNTAREAGRPSPASCPGDGPCGLGLHCLGRYPAGAGLRTCAGLGVLVQATDPHRGASSSFQRSTQIPGNVPADSG